ncbi:Protein disabled, partial [Stegodyphus mimosarum]
MQDKETVDEAEEALTCKAETISDRRGSIDKKDSFEGHSKKESTKDGKFAFKKMKQPKKEKPDKNSPSRFEGEGVIFKAKLIGVESVPDARGDKMCQDAMQRLKLNVKNMGPHKRKINVCVSLQGIKIKDEKLTSVIYHHPVSLISFISQDITDARAFGYVFGSTDEPHQFIAIKTEKPAFHVVLALRDLFQTVLNTKQEQIDAKENKSDVSKTEKRPESKDVESIDKTESEIQIKTQEEQKPKDENIYFEVLLTEPLKLKEEEIAAEKAEDKEPVKTVDDLLGLQNEMTKLQEGINQMDSSIAAVAAFNSDIPMPENDPFDTSFVLGPKRDSLPFPMPTPIPLASPVPANDNNNQSFNGHSTVGDKYAVFNTIDSTPSIFEASEGSSGTDTAANNDVKDLEDEMAKKAPPAKPPRLSKSASPDLSVFAELDPLGKDRPYKDKTEFFQDVKNPPKKEEEEESPYATIVKVKKQAETVK